MGARIPLAAAAAVIAVAAVFVGPRGHVIAVPTVGGSAAWTCQFLQEKATPSFDLRFRIAADKESAARLLAGDPAAADSFFLEMGPDGIFCGRAAGTNGASRELRCKRSLAELSGALLVFERRPHRWGLIADGQLLAEGDEAPSSSERLGFALKGGAARISELRCQAVQDIFFADSFMRTPSDPAPWTELCGNWRVNTLKDPLLSANAFFYSATGAPKAASVVGDWFWSEISFRAACRPAPRSAVGMYLCYRGPGDYYLFRWTSRDSDKGVRQFIRCTAGKESVLAESPGGCEPEQWVTLSAVLGTGWAQIFLDDTSIFLVHDAGLTIGQAGLYVESADQPVKFDDVEVKSRPAILADFSSPKIHRWLASGGEWLQLAPAGWPGENWSGGVTVNAPEAARLLWGGPGWKDYTVSARIAPWQSGSMGLCFRYQDDLNYYSLRWTNAQTASLQICRTEEGRETVLAERALPLDDKLHNLSVSTQGGDIIASLDQEPVLQTADYSFVRGRAGLFAQGVNGGAFSDVFFFFTPGRLPLAQFTEAFSAEQSMSVWSGALSDWFRKDPQLAAKGSRNIWWHRVNFTGDVRMDVRLAEPPPPGAEVGMILNGNGRDTSVGYLGVLRRVAGADGDDMVSVELLDRDVLVGQSEIDWTSGPRALSLRHSGNSVCLCVGETAVLSAPAAGRSGESRIGWYSAQVPVEVGDVDIYSDNFVNYTFNSAPTDWRVGAGVWEVTNKWVCDDRWSFFSGRGDNLAVLWNKRPLHGDFTIEFYVGNKMNQNRDNGYGYAKDMNLTICGDGKEISSGYSFLFGGFNNRETSLFRQGDRFYVPPRDQMIVIDRGALHRKWYHISVSRKGNRLEMRVDDRLVIATDDPSPLADGHWALWTHDNGIMVSRVRVSAEKIAPRDPVDRSWPVTSCSFY